MVPHRVTPLTSRHQLHFQATPIDRSHELHCKKSTNLQIEKNKQLIKQIIGGQNNKKIIIAKVVQFCADIIWLLDSTNAKLKICLQVVVNILLKTPPSVRETILTRKDALRVTNTI